MAGETTNNQKSSGCKVRFSAVEAMFLMNILDLFVSICMVIRGIDMVVFGAGAATVNFDMVVRGIWTVLIGSVLTIMVFFVFQILYSYFKFMLTFLGRGFVYLFFASVIGGSDGFGVFIYFGFYIVGFINVFAQFAGVCGCFPLRYPRPFFMSGVEIGGKKMGVDYESDQVKKEMDDGSDFGNTGGGSAPAQQPKEQELQNPFEDSGGAYGGRA